METNPNQPQSNFQTNKEESMESAKHRSKEMLERGSEMFEEGREAAQRKSQEMLGRTKQAVSEAYEKTSRQLSGSYDQFMGYSRENPGKTTLIALGTGLGVGLLLGSVSRTSRPSRYAQPIVNALSEVAREYFR